MRPKFMMVWVALVALLSAILVGASPATASVPISKPVKASEPVGPTKPPVNAKLGKPIKSGDSANLRGQRGTGPQSGGRQTRAVSCTGNPPDGFCHMYAGVRQTINSSTNPITGHSVRYEVENPLVRPWDTFSLFEHAVADFPSTGLNGVGAGWINNKALFGDNKTRFFVESFTDGSQNGWGTGFIPWTGAPMVHGQDMTSIVGDGVGIRTSWNYFDASNGCAPPSCDPGWWLSYAKAVGDPYTYLGVFPATLWPTNTFTGNEVDQVQGYGESAVTQTPSQTHIGSGSILNRTTSSSMALAGSSAPTASWDTTLNATDLSKWKVTRDSATSFSFGGPGGFEDIISTVSPTNDCSGEGTGTNPSGLGALCTYSTQSSNVPSSAIVTQIDMSAGTACRGNVGTSAGYAPIRNVALTGVKKVTFWANGTCTGTGTQLNHGRIVLPAALQAQANLSYRVDSTYATCATGWPTTAPTC